MYAVSSLLYYAFAQNKDARASYLRLMGGGKPHKQLRPLYASIETGKLSVQQYDALLRLGITREAIEHALVETHRQQAEEVRQTFQPSLTALFEKDQEPAGSRTAVMARSAARRVALPEGVATRPWVHQLPELKACIARHGRYLADEFSSAARVEYLGELTGYAYRPGPNVTVLLSVDGELMDELPHRFLSD